MKPAYPYSESGCEHALAQFAPTDDRRLMRAKCLTCGKTAEVGFLGEDDVDRAGKDALAALREVPMMN